MNPALARAASLLRPGDTETLLLRACLAPPGEVPAAWEELVRRVPEPVELFRRDRGDLRRLAPLLHVSLREAGVEPDPDTAGRLRLAHFREELRNRECRRIVRTVSGALGEAGHRPAVLRGTALGETLYDSPVLRHSHDLELLFADDTAVEDAGRILAAAGLSPVQAPGRNETGDRVLRHPSGMPVALRSRLFRSPHVSLPTDRILSAAERARIAGTAVDVLCPADALLHAIGGAALRPGRSSLQWACDAFLLIRRRPDLDWGRFCRLARQARLRIPSSVLLRYLHRRLSSPVPAPVLEGMEEGLAEVEPLERDLLLFGLRSTLSGGIGELLSECEGWAARTRILAWILFPSAAYLRRAYGSSGGAEIPVLYLTRPLSFLFERGRPGPAAGR